MQFNSYRPAGLYSATDKKLDKVFRSVNRFLIREYAIIPGELHPMVVEELACMITEFAEDTYFEIGLWKSLERHNEHLFGNPLPLSKLESEEHSDFPFDEYRLSHLLWNSLLILNPQMCISPHHKSLTVLAEKLSPFLEGQFKRIRGQSSVKKFLASPNKNGVEVKKKLVWLGTKSYLFRLLCVKFSTKVSCYSVPV